MCLDFARSLQESALNKLMMESLWDKYFDRIPTTIELLLPSLLLKFEYLLDNSSHVLRIGMRTTPDYDSSCEVKRYSTVVKIN